MTGGRLSLPRRRRRLCLWNGIDGSDQSVPDLLEGWLDLVCGNDEVVSSQLRRRCVLDAGSGLGVIHGDSRGWVDGLTAVSSLPSGVMGILNCISTSVCNSEDFCMVVSEIAGSTGSNGSPRNEPQLTVGVEVEAGQQGATDGRQTVLE